MTLNWRGQFHVDPYPLATGLFTLNSLAHDKNGDFTGGGDLGSGWSSTVGSRLEFPEPNRALLTREDGSEVSFTLTSGGWQVAHGFRLELIQEGSDWIARSSAGWEWRYGPQGRITAIRDTAGNEYSILHASGKVSTANTATGLGVTFHYGSSGGLESFTDTSGNTWHCSRDTNGRLTTLIDPNHGAVQFEYDRAGRLSSFTDLGGHKWRFAYYGAGLRKHRVKSIMDPDGHTYQYDYVIEGTEVRTVMTDLGGGDWQSVHARTDSPSLVRRRSPPGAWVHFERDSHYRITRFTDGRGEEWTYGYDAHGNLLEMVDPLQSSTSYTYDSQNRLTSKSADGATWSFFRDDPLHPWAITRWVQPPDDAGQTATTSLEYFGPADGPGPGNWNGLVSKVIDDTGAETRFEYGEHGKLIGVQEGPAGAPGMVSVRYDQGSLPVFLEQSGMTYSADAPALPPLPAALQGRLNRQLISTQRDWTGQITSQAFTVEVPLDSGSGWELSEITETRTYDAYGRLTSRGVVSEEPLAHVSSPTASSSSRAFSSLHDALGSQAITAPDGTLVRIERDGAGCVNHVSTGDAGPHELAVDIAYEANGLIRSRSFQDGTSVHFEWRPNAVIESTEYRDGTTVLLRTEFQYDSRNLPIGVTETSPNQVVSKAYAYDSRRRLTSESFHVSPPGTLEQWDYVYDGAGNRLEAILHLDGALCSIDRYSYDSQDPATYQSHNNRLTRIEREDSRGVILAACHFFYDNPFGHVSAMVTREAGASTCTATRFAYTQQGAPWLAWDETWTDRGNGPTNLVRGDILETRQWMEETYLWRWRDGETLVPLAEEWVSSIGWIRSRYSVDSEDGTETELTLPLVPFGVRDAGGAIPSNHLADHLGSIRLHGVAGNYAPENYLAFGTSRSNSTSVPHAGFAGGLGAQQGWMGAPLTGASMVRMGHRNYAPNLGRFLMRDPISIAGDLNVYAFVDAKPTSSVDPLGLAAQGGQLIKPIDIGVPLPDVPCFVDDEVPFTPEPSPIYGPPAPPGWPNVDVPLPGDPDSTRCPEPQPCDPHFIGPLLPKEGDPWFIGPPRPPTPPQI